MLSFRFFRPFNYVFTILRPIKSNRIVVDDIHLDENAQSIDNSIPAPLTASLHIQDTPEKLSAIFQDDICADLICEKKDGQWMLYLISIKGSKCRELFGRNFNSDEKFALSELMDADKFEIHQRLVADVLDRGPQAHNWTILFQRMYERPIKILNPLTHTEIIVDIRMELDTGITYKVGEFYKFYVFLNHRTQEHAEQVRLKKIFDSAQEFSLKTSECSGISNAQTLLQLIQEIQDLSCVEYFDLQVMALTINHILFFSNQIRLQLQKSHKSQDMQRLSDTINHLCSSECLDIISYLEFKIGFEQKKQSALIKKIALSFMVLGEIQIYLLSNLIIEALESLLSSLIILYSITDAESKAICLQIHVDLNKQFHAAVHLLDPNNMFFKWYQETQKSPILNEDMIEFKDVESLWKNMGGELSSSSQSLENTVFEFSIFATHLKPQEFILNNDELSDFTNTLKKIHYQNKKSILFADDGVVNIKFLLKQTMEFLDIGKIPARSPTTKLEFAKNWKELGCYILSFVDWYFVCVPDGICAQNLLSLWQPNAIISDQEMPHLNGTNLIQWFRAEYPEKSWVKIALHSANSLANQPEVLQPLDAIFFTKADKALFKSFIDSIGVTLTQQSVLTAR